MKHVMFLTKAYRDRECAEYVLLRKFNECRKRNIVFTRYKPVVNYYKNWNNYGWDWWRGCFRCTVKT